MGQTDTSTVFNVIGQSSFAVVLTYKFNIDYYQTCGNIGPMPQICLNFHDIIAKMNANMDWGGIYWRRVSFKATEGNRLLVKNVILRPPKSKTEILTSVEIYPLTNLGKQNKIVWISD